MSNPKNGFSKHIYNYDAVFMPSQGQDDVFDEIKPFVQTALDGMNVCIFAYGQTGSGKTFTMEGPCIDEPSMDGSFVDENMQIHYKAGILPRVACYL